ncbi:alpha/beta hydrolase family protein [Antiquaquibacter oligotrophicus]|uniref:alpha/beta hydrolase n=1 Tax=Antiquaquibacter oligotrophicus TaxID=2880260 RepID=UPI002AC96B43|nr:alpha/beta hydrolase [Antiquaquibacter oligotrophicus]UDF12933.1 alpha/beta hydrolase family protein [Antiquaquibacter oligotrophicus]
MAIVTGALVMPTNSPAAAASAPSPRSVIPSPYIGPEPGASADLQGSRLLQELSLLSVPRIDEFLTANPGAVDNLIEQPPPAQDVSLWWNAMDFDHRSAVVGASPQLVGNLEGVPYPTRDLANRALLADTIFDLNALIANPDVGRTAVDAARRQLVMLDSISSALVNPARSLNRTLLSLDVNGQGRAAIVIGDLHTADYVSYLVPGMFFTIENQMVDWTKAAEDLYSEQLTWLARLGETNAKVATVAWIGYPTPNLTNVGGIGNAEIGRDTLARAIEGIQTLRGKDQPYLSVIAHSYGSTAALLALTEYDFEIDALAMVGSPGSPARSVDELHVRDGNVWVGEAPWDPIPNSAYFGSDPGSPDYGAHAMSVSGGADPVTKRALLGSSGHNEYFTYGTESMRNFALIAIGRSGLVTTPDAPAVVTAEASH